MSAVADAMMVAIARVMDHFVTEAEASAFADRLGNGALTEADKDAIEAEFRTVTRTDIGRKPIFCVHCGTRLSDTDVADELRPDLCKRCRDKGLDAIAVDVLERPYPEGLKDGIALRAKEVQRILEDDSRNPDSCLSPKQSDSWQSGENPEPIL